MGLGWLGELIIEKLLYLLFEKWNLNFFILLVLIFGFVFMLMMYLYVVVGELVLKMMVI